jgi:hypothetical protein
MSDAVGWAAQRMTAIRFEEQKLWPEAAEAWHRAIARAKEEGRHVTLVGQRLLTEMEARAAHAITRATHPGLEEPVADVEGRVRSPPRSMSNWPRRITWRPANAGRKPRTPTTWPSGWGRTGAWARSIWKPWAI